MKTDDNILFGIVGAVAYIWGMIVLASYLIQSCRLISFQDSRVIEEGLERFF